MNQLAQDLTAARAIIQDPAKWTQNHLAVDSNGTSHPSTHPLASNIHWEGLKGNDPMACQWCALGAVQKATGCTGGDERFEAAYAALSKVSFNIFNQDIAAVNDNDRRGHAAVLACFDKAIEATK